VKLDRDANRRKRIIKNGFTAEKPVLRAGSEMRRAVLIECFGVYGKRMKGLIIG
jgi:hypothetical protein